MADLVGRAQADRQGVQGGQPHRLGGGAHLLPRAGDLPGADRAGLDPRPRRRVRYTAADRQPRQVAPGPAKEIFTNAIENLQGGDRGARVVFVVGLGALWSASSYVAAFMRASNSIYDIEEGRPIWKTLPVRVGLTLVLLAPARDLRPRGRDHRWPGAEGGRPDRTRRQAVNAWDIVKWPVLLLVVSFMFALLYWAAPNVKHPGSAGSVPGVCSP